MNATKTSPVIHNATPSMDDGMRKFPVIDVMKAVYKVEYTFECGGLRQPVRIADVLHLYGTERRADELREAMAAGMVLAVGVWNSNKVFAINEDGTRGICCGLNRV